MSRLDHLRGIHHVFRTASTAAAAAVAIAALVAPAGSAFAKFAVIDDAKGDTYKITGWDETTGEVQGSKSKKDVNADLDKVIVKHTKKRIELVARYSSLSKKGMDPAAGVSLKSDDGSRMTMYGGGYKTDAGWQTTGSVYSDTVIERRNPFQARGATCEGFKVAINWKADELAVSAPRSCFGSPAWVKAHAEAVGTFENDGQLVQIYDNAHTSKANMKGWTNRIKKG